MIQEIDKNEYYESSDFYLVAYLLAKGFELLGTEKIDIHRTLFILRDIPQREKFIKDYYTNKASIDPLVFKEKLQILKSIIYSEDFKSK